MLFFSQQVSFCMVIYVFQYIDIFRNILSVLQYAYVLYTAFCSIRTLMLYMAFRLNYRAAKRYELVEICDDRLTVTTGWDGVATDLKAFDPYWVRLQLSKSESWVGPLHLTSHGQKLEIASFLGPDERCDFADALDDALQNYRAA